MSYPEAPFLSRTELPIQNTRHLLIRGRRRGQTQGRWADDVTNVVKPEQFEAPCEDPCYKRRQSASKNHYFQRKSRRIDGVCNNTQQKGQKTQRGRLAGGPPPTGRHSGPALRAGQTAAAPDGARNTSGATSTSHTNTRVRQRGGYRSTHPLSAHSATASSRLRPNDRQSWRRRRIHRNMPPTTAAPRPAPPIRPSKPVRARRCFRLGLVAGTSGAT